MELQLIRSIFTEQSTIGLISVNGVFECYSLENPPAPTAILGPEHVAIPYGKYRVDIRWSNRFKRMVPGLIDVPGRTDIEIHIGNAVKDTHGCILVGRERLNNFVGHSLEAFEGLFAKLRGATDRSEEVWIDIAPAPFKVPQAEEGGK